MTPTERGLLQAYAEHHDIPQEQAFSNARMILRDHTALIRQMSQQLPICDPDKMEAAANAWALCWMDVNE